MNPRLLDVFHDAADDHVRAVADGIHVHLHGVFQKLVDQHRQVGRHLNRLAHIRFQAVVVEHDLHGPSAQHVGGPHDYRIADALRDASGLLLGGRGVVGGLPQAELRDQLLKALAVLGAVDAVGGRPKNGHPGTRQRQRQVKRCLAAKLHDDAVRLLDVNDVHHIFKGQRLEVQPVRGVVVGAHGLRVAVHHDGLIAVFLKRERRVHAAVIELDSLPDAVRTAAENHDFAHILRLGLAFLLV